MNVKKRDSERKREMKKQNDDLPSDLASSCRYFRFGFAFAKMSINTDGRTTRWKTDGRTVLLTFIFIFFCGILFLRRESFLFYFVC